MSDTIPSVTAEQRDRMPAALMDVVLRCLDRDPDARFPNVAALARALLPLAPDSVPIVKRIEATVPPVSPTELPSPSPPIAPVPSGSTLVSAHSPFVPATSTTHLLDASTTVPMQRSNRGPVLALIAAIVAVVSWSLFRSGHAQLKIDPVPSAASAPVVASTPVVRPREALQPTRELQPPSPAPSAREAATASARAPEPTTTTLGVPKKSLPPRPKLSRPAEPAASAEIPMTSASVTRPSSSVDARHLSPPRPASTADPQNRPE